MERTQPICRSSSIQLLLVWGSQSIRKESAFTCESPHDRSAVNAGVSVSDFGSSEKVVDANHVFPILVIPDRVVKDFPEDEGKRCVRKWVMFPKS